MLYVVGNTSSLVSLSSDAVMKVLITTNPQEREVKPLVDGLEWNIPRAVRELLLPGIGPLEVNF